MLDWSISRTWLLDCSRRVPSCVWHGATELLGRPRRLRPWDDSEYLIRGDEKLPILAAPTNGDSEYFPDDS